MSNTKVIGGRTVRWDDERAAEAYARGWWTRDTLADSLADAGRTARAFARVAPLEVIRLPFASPLLVTAMLWHRRLDDVPAHRWLRNAVLRVGRTV